MQHDRHYYVEYGWGAEDQNKMGTPERGEQKIKSRNTQDQSSTAGRQVVVLFFPKTAEGLSKSRSLRNVQQRLLCQSAISVII